MTVPHPAADVASQEVIRPAAVLSETHARLILQGLAQDDVQSGGHWWTRVGTWRRYESPWAPGSAEPGDAVHVGTISCVYDSPARYCVTVFRVSMTSYGLRQGWTIESLCDEAFGHAGLTLADCPRASLTAPPRPFDQVQRDTGPPR
ncbi:MAG: hypothetical protein M3Z02_08930 [Actinomycetota bacterium]|nr:hypothetical protein [Actinomycetota bacterium]